MREIGCLLISFLLIFQVPAYSVEFGVDATGDSNAISIDGSSGFLYSDRIVFTAAHLFDNSGSVKYWEQQGSVPAPGVRGGTGEKRYKVVKVLIAPTYKPRSDNDQTRIDDFAILILNESISMRNQVKVATKEDLERFISEKTPVSMVGYGLQSPSQRMSIQGNDRAPHKMTSSLVDKNTMQNFYRTNIQRIGTNQTILEFGIPNSEKLGAICDGDSGAGFFVEKDQTKFYIGPVGGQQWAIPNCRSDANATFGTVGGMSGITATFKFLDLIKEAEEFVAQEKSKEKIKAEEERIASELKAKQEADAKAEAEAKAKAEADADEKEYITVMSDYQNLMKRIADLRNKYPFVKTLPRLQQKMSNLPIAKESDLSTAKYNIESVNRSLDQSEVVWSKNQKTTITCIKGKLTKRVTGINPKCPTGYKKKP